MSLLGVESGGLVEDNESTCGTNREKPPVAVVAVDTSERVVKKIQKNQEEDIDKILEELGQIQPIPTPPPLAQVGIGVEEEEKEGRAEEEANESAAAKKKKRMKEKEAAAAYAEEEDDKVAVKKVPRHVRELREQLARRKEAEERRKREEEERRRKEEEDRRRQEESERLAEEAKRGRKEREKEKRLTQRQLAIMNRGKTRFLLGKASLFPPLILPPRGPHMKEEKNRSLFPWKPITMLDVEASEDSEPWTNKVENVHEVR